MATGILRGGLQQDEATLVLKNGAATQLTITHPATNTAARVLTLPADDAAYSLPAVLHGGDTAKVVKFSTSGSTTATALTLTVATTANRVLTLPDATDTLVGKATTDTLTNKSLDADTNTITNIENADIKAAAAIALNKLAAITASRVPVGDGSGFLVASAVTATELGYVSGLSSAIQTQLDTKLTASSTHTLTNKTYDAEGTGNVLSNITDTNIKAGAAIAYSKLALTGEILDADVDAAAAIALTKLAATTASRALVSDASGFVVASAATATEVGYLSGVSSAIQTQMNTKITADSVTTLTNKTYDAEGTGNALSNITNTHIKATAAIAYSKLAALTSANILVGSAGNVATVTAVTGDISLTNGGVTAYAGTVPIAKGGTGQVARQAAMDALSPTSTKGQLLVDDGTNVVALTPGANGTVLTAASGEASGYEWSAPLVNPMTTAEDIIYGGVAGAATRKAIGTAYHVLKSSATSTLEYGLLVNDNIAGAAAIEGSKLEAATNLVAGAVTTAAQSFSGVKTFVDGLDFDVTDLTDAVASKLGYKEYTAADVTVTGTNTFAPDDCFFIPYQLQGGGWRLRFNITGTSVSATSVTITLASTTFYNMGGTNEGQACSAKTSANASTRATANDNAGTILITCGSASTGWSVSGDVRLASKPTWVA